MPAYPVTRNWSASIAVTAGDYVQNKGHNNIHVCPISPAAEDDALELGPGEAVEIVNATQIFVATLTGTISRIGIARGF